MPLRKPNTHLQSIESRSRAIILRHRQETSQHLSRSQSGSNQKPNPQNNNLALLLHVLQFHSKHPNATTRSYDSFWLPCRVPAAVLQQNNCSNTAIRLVFQDFKLCHVLNNWSRVGARKVDLFPLSSNWHIWPPVTTNSTPYVQRRIPHVGFRGACW